jgi:hypothetical protein
MSNVDMSQCQRMSNVDFFQSRMFTCTIVDKCQMSSCPLSTHSYLYKDRQRLNVPLFHCQISTCPNVNTSNRLNVDHQKSTFANLSYLPNQLFLTLITQINLPKYVLNALTIQGRPLSRYLLRVQKS